MDLADDTWFLRAGGHCKNCTGVLYLCYAIYYCNYYGHKSPAAAAETGCILTVEVHNIAGGMGSAVAEFLAQNNPVKMKMIGIPDETPPPGPREMLLEKYGLNVSGIAKAARQLLESK